MVYVTMIDEDENIMEEEPIGEEAIPPFDAVCRAKFLSQEKTSDFDSVRDTKWVFNALGVSGLRATDAPSTGAWRMLHVLDNDLALLKGFYAGPFAKLLANQVQKEKESDRVDDDRTEFGLIDRLLREPDDLAPILNDLEERAKELAAKADYSASRV